jgi:hypothetical protein
MITLLLQHLQSNIVERMRGSREHVVGGGEHEENMRGVNTKTFHDQCCFES